MDFYTRTISDSIKALSSDINLGLDEKKVQSSRLRYGKNVLSKKKKQSFFSKLFNALKEPMLLILVFGFILALGVNIGKYMKSGEGDFTECLGIFLAIVLSVTITLFMEGSSQKAFSILNKIYDNVAVKVIREGKVIILAQSEVVVGDIIIIESGDKCVCDGRLIESNDLSIDESALTGESMPQSKSCDLLLKANTPLAERKNMVYSGTYVLGGSGKMLVTAVGDNSEIGNIATGLSDKKDTSAPLQQKLNKLGKVITIIGAVCAVIVFGINIVRLAITNQLNFSCVQELFISSIILIIAAVPEGMPTIVAVSLALNMIKLARENALIKKMTATETAGAVSVICSDKTGTLTQNKMSVINVCTGEICMRPDKFNSLYLQQNFACNSTADITLKNKKLIKSGSATECALLEAFIKNNKKNSYEDYRLKYPTIERINFDSNSKFMSTLVKVEYSYRLLTKGAPEVVIGFCELSEKRKQEINSSILSFQKKGFRVLCFAHKDYEIKPNKIANEGLIFDGYVTIADPIREDVLESVSNCRRAGIKIKMLTGDNMITAYAIAKELGLTNDMREVVNANDLEGLDDQSFKSTLSKISVIARSTPLLKLRVVKALKEMGEVVAVTGDGINDAPAIKQADVGIAMGQTGSEITKECADIILVNDSFSTLVNAIAFGRNVYQNLKRFILFQLSVNLSALLFITVCAILGLPSPFNTLQLLWINVIMDGPPALTLGLEGVDLGVMKNKPVQRSQGIVSKKMFFRILFNGVFIGLVLLAQYLYNFLSVPSDQQASAMFSLFIFFHLFNAFNCRGLGADSMFRNISKNKIMLVTFLAVFVVHFMIVQFFYKLFAISPMQLFVWIKCVLVASSILIITETYKFVYRMLKKSNREKLSKKKYKQKTLYS